MERIGTLAVFFLASALLPSMSGVAHPLLAQDTPPAAGPRASLAPATGPPAGALSTAIAGSSAQPIAYDTEPLPHDPTAALLLASKANGLGGEGLKPWYLKAHYQSYDLHGNPAAKGVFEVYWAGKDRFRVSYTEEGFTQTQYHTPDGRYLAGSDGEVPYAESLIWGELTHPIGVPEAGPRLDLHEKKVSNISMTCVGIHFPNGPEENVYCMDPQLAVLRVAEFNHYAAVFNKIAIFQHHFLAQQISLRDGGQHVLDLDLDEVRGMRTTDTQALTPPQDARKTATVSVATGNEDPDEQRGIVSPKMINGRIVDKANPRYPMEAKQRHAEGTVRITATIGKTGGFMIRSSCTIPTRP